MGFPKNKIGVPDIPRVFAVTVDIVAVANNWHWKNALLPILITELGIIIDVMPMLANAPIPIVASVEVGVNVTVANK